MCEQKKAKLLRVSQIHRHFKKSLNIVIGVGRATQAGADQAQAAAKQGKGQHNVHQSGGPEGKQVHGLVAVELWLCCIPYVVGLINRVDPHITYILKKKKEVKIKI